MLRLVNQVLELSKVEAGNLKLNLKHGNIVSFTAYLIRSFHAFADSKNIRLRFIKEEENIQMDFDWEKLEKVLYNLIANALKFTPEGGEVRVCVQTKDEVCQIRIIDTGVGISEQHLGKVFNRFYQIDNEITQVEAGTGIGLALAKEFVNLMKGKIWVESQLGIGSTFYLETPNK